MGKELYGLLIVFCKWKLLLLAGQFSSIWVNPGKSYSYELWHTWVKGSVTPRDLTRLCHPFSPGTAASRGDLRLLLLCVDHFWMSLLGSLVVGWGWAGVFHRIFPSWIWPSLSATGKCSQKTLWASLLVRFPWGTRFPRSDYHNNHNSNDRFPLRDVPS